MNANSSSRILSALVLCVLSLSSVPAKTKIEPLCFSNGQVGHPISDEKKHLMIVSAQIRESTWTAFKTQPRTTREKDEFLRSKFGNRKCSYVLRLRSNGTIENLEIRESSGTDLNDRQVAEIIRSAAPFRASKLRNQIYLIEFPELAVSLIPGS